MLNKTKFRLAITIPTLVILSLLATPAKVFATTLFEDNFNSGNSNNWIVFGNSGWNVQDGQYNIHLDPGLSNTTPADSVWNYNWTNIIYSVDLTGNSGVDKNILVKFKNTANFIEIHANGDGIYLDKTATQGGGNLGFIPTQLQNGITYHFRSEINNDKIKVYLNNNLIFNVTETQPLITNWKIGLRAGTGSVRPTDVSFDNILVTDLPAPTPTPSPTPTPLPNLNVPDIKQYSAPWGNQTYDHATSWSPSNPTITHWGCALTSADMLLKYYGFIVDPDGLNTWLNSQPDGYVGNGLLNWLAISRYSKTHLTGNLPSLEFLRATGTNENLTNEINNNRPAILEVPGHFIVAKGLTPTSFNINDPAYSNHPTLDSYNNTFNSIETYIPSHTNLSYIMLTIDPKFNLKVLDTNGNEITGDTFIQNPLIDDIDNTTKSGNSLQIFMFPKPANGNYKTQVTGNGIYELDSFLYDTNGNVNLKKTNGIIGNNQTDEFQVTIGGTNSTTTSITTTSIINDLNEANKEKLIKSNYVYTQILTMLNTSSKLISLHQTKVAKVDLNSALQFIKVYTPSQIDLGFSSILQSEIQTLINSL